MTIKQIEPLLPQDHHTSIWIFTPKGENALDIIHLDPKDKYQPRIDRNRLKLERLKNLPHKVSCLIPYHDIFYGDDQIVIHVRLGKGVGWNV